MDKENKEFNKMVEAIGNYMKKEGWDIIVISNPQIHKPSGSLKYNFELTFKFTGKELTPKINNE